MTFVQTIMIYFVSIGVFAGVDYIWLSKVAPQLYKANIGHLLATKPNMPAAVAFYALFLVGLLVFAIVPALNKGSLNHAMVYGALFGLFTYGTFDLTNQAVLKDWPTKITLIDMTWGVVLCATVSAIVYLIAHKYIV